MDLTIWAHVCHPAFFEDEKGHKKLKKWLKENTRSASINWHAVQTSKDGTPYVDGCRSRYGSLGKSLGPRRDVWYCLVTFKNEEDRVKYILKWA